MSSTATQKRPFQKLSSFMQSKSEFFNAKKMPNSKTSVKIAGGQAEAQAEAGLRSRPAHLPGRGSAGERRRRARGSAHAVLTAFASPRGSLVKNRGTGWIQAPKEFNERKMCRKKKLRRTSILKQRQFKVK